MAHPQFTPSETEIDYIAIPLLDRAGLVKAWTLVDLEDLTVVINHVWRLSHGGYAIRSSSSVWLHRAVMRLRGKKIDPQEVDHRSRNKLDNRKGNLRITDRPGNMQNQSKQKRITSSEYRGVSWSNNANRWQAYVKVRGKTVHLGYFTNEEDAAQAAREARQRLMPYAID